MPGLQQQQRRESKGGHGHAADPEHQHILAAPGK
jgi:hypothetical protein